MSFGLRRAAATSVAAVALLTASVAAFAKTSHAAPVALAGAHPALYSASQATAGSKAYAANCASCHGAQLEGGVGPALTGATLNTLAKNTKLSVGDMFTFISQQMPLNAPASLSKAQYSQIMAYILKFNGYPAGTKELTYASATNSKIVMHSAK
ncbi:MAG: cytochrome c [Vulcanimicrobiaceae bacterium]